MRVEKGKSLYEEKLKNLQEDDISNRFKYVISVIQIIDVIAGVAGAMEGV